MTESANGYPPESRTDIDALPPALRQLLDDELAAGNSIVEVGHHHPAAPCGAFVMLAMPVTTHPRESTDAMRFYHRNNSQYSGEFADLNRHFFILEAPLPPPAPPDMDAIRAAANVQYEPDRDGYPEGWRPPPPPDQSLIDRFRASRAINYEKWHDGEGFDLEALRAMTPSQQSTVEASLIPPSGWREVEALVVIGSPSAQRALRAAAREESLQVRLAVADYAPELVRESTRIDMLMEALRSAQIMTGLSEALDQIEDFHPPVVVDALFRGLLEREGEVAYHCAEMLALIHGAIPSRYDWSLRPLFLRFTTNNPDERRAALEELQLHLTPRPIT